MDARISAVKTLDYQMETLKGAVRRHIEALDMAGVLRPGCKVLLKPNLLMKRRPEEFTTTHPALVEAVGHVLREMGITHITLADSPGGPYAKVALEAIYAATGMTEAAKNAGIRLNTATGFRELPLPEGALCHSFSIIDPAWDADCIINLPKLKTHAMMTLSGGVKNLFGCIPGLQKPELHLRFPEKPVFGRMLVDLSLLLKPALTIVDAVSSMEGDGPSGGGEKFTGYTMAARNVFALDLALCDFIGLEPREVDTVAHAINQGLCPDEAGLLEYLCDGKPDAVKFQLPASQSLSFAAKLPRPLQPIGDWVQSRMIPRPVIRRAVCIGCGKCAESCAPEAIALQNKKAAIDPSKCIRCFCCHEMCPVRAVHIRRARLLGW